jgi:hypothetical protein
MDDIEVGGEGEGWIFEPLPRKLFSWRQVEKKAKKPVLLLLYKYSLLSGPSFLYSLFLSSC